MDAIDRILLIAMQADAHLTNAELGRRAGLSAPAVLERVRKLEKKGIVRKYVALLDQSKLGYGVTAFISVSLTGHQRKAINAFTKAMKSIPEVLECHHVTGDSDYLLKIVVKDIPSMEHFIVDQLAKAPSVRQIRTSFVLDDVKAETAIPIPELPKSRPSKKTSKA